MSYQDSISFNARMAITKERWLRIMNNYFTDLLDIKSGEGVYYPSEDKYIMYDVNQKTLFAINDKDQIAYYEQAYTDIIHDRNVKLYIPGKKREMSNLTIIMVDLFNLTPTYCFTHEDVEVSEHYMPFFGYNKHAITSLVGTEKYCFVLYNRIRMMFPDVFERVIFVDKMDPKLEEIQLIDAMFDASYALVQKVENKPDEEVDIVEVLNEGIQHDGEEYVTNSEYESSINEDVNSDDIIELVEYKNEMINKMDTNQMDMPKIENMKNMMSALRSKIWKIQPKKFLNATSKMNNYIMLKKNKERVVNATQLKFEEIYNHLCEKFNVTAIGNALDMCSLPGGSVCHMLKLGYDHVYSHIFRDQSYNSNSTKMFDQHVESGVVTIVNPDNDGDLTNHKNIIDIIKNIKTNKIDINFIFADGAFGDGELPREVENDDIIHGEILLATGILSFNGTLVLKIFDMYLENGVKKMMYLSSIFDKLDIFEPEYSGRCSEEKYLICYKLNNHNDPVKTSENLNYIYDMLSQSSISLAERYSHFYDVHLDDKEEDDNQTFNSNSSTLDEDESVTFIEYLKKSFSDNEIYPEVEIVLNMKSACLAKVAINNGLYYVSNRAFSLIAFGDARFFIICKNQKKVSRVLMKAIPWCDIKEIEYDFTTRINESVDKVMTKKSELITATSGVERMVKTLNIRSQRNQIETSMTKKDFEDYDQCVKSNKVHGVDSYLKFSIQGIIYPCGKHSNHLCSISLYSLGKFKRGQEPNNDFFSYCSCGNVYANETLKFLCGKSLHAMNDLVLRDSGTLPINSRFQVDVDGRRKNNNKVTPFTNGNVGGFGMNERFKRRYKAKYMNKNNDDYDGDDDKSDIQHEN